MKRAALVITGAIAAVALFGGGYAVGTNGGPTHTAALSAGSRVGLGSQGGTGAQGGATAGGRAAGTAPISGKVIAVSADSITIELVGRTGANGSTPPPSVIVLVGTGTRVIEATTQDGKLAKLKTGDQITAVGSTDPTTGVMSAQAVVLGAADAIRQLFASGNTRNADPRPVTSGTGPVEPAGGGAGNAGDGGHGPPGFFGVPGFGAGGH